MVGELQAALAEARALGFLGPGPLAAHEGSAAAFIEALGELRGEALDLGSGGGVPGLLLAAHYQEVTWVLLEQNRRRTSFLARWVAALGWSTRVKVLRRTAEDAGHDPALRGTFATVVARSFGPPAMTAECGVAFLGSRGRFAVAEPPEARESRWPVEGLATIGLTRLSERDSPIALFEAESQPPVEIPRPRRLQQRLPLW